LDQNDRGDASEQHDRDVLYLCARDGVDGGAVMKTRKDEEWDENGDGDDGSLHYCH
jgi:hypothetical protein